MKHPQPRVWQRRLPPALALLAALSLLLPLAACVSPARSPVPQAVASAAVAGSMPYRFWGDEAPRGLDLFTREIMAQRTASGLVARPPTFLALSGGGSDGAFGAGLLVGWAERGDRPDFDVVTGVSTGALIAPFAFLGEDYDDELEAAYTTLSRESFARVDILGALTGASLAVSNNAPFRETIARFADGEMLARIAAEHERGRRLLIGTTQLDAGRPVVWNVGAIAASDLPHKLELFRAIVLASASIPGVFEPVLIEVELDGARFDEMHVDGGVTNQVFLYPIEARRSAGSRATSHGSGGRLYIIRNGKVEPRYEPVKSSIPAIAERSLGTMVRAQGVGDLYRLHAISQRDGLAYRLAVIPPEFDAPYDGEFDLDYMRPLFALGRRLGRDGYDWLPSPPGVR